ncbi:FHA domain-containing protein [Ornithinimicrobium sp. Arc0846-15]|nr:FHA domain-containing protein [Ornithinimicrobium laminariae]
MTHRFNIDADLTFSMERPASDGNGPEQSLSGTITGSGRHLQVSCDDVGAMSSGLSFREARQVAAALAGQGLAVTLAGENGPIVTIGDVKGSRLARLATRSKHIRIDDLKAAASLRGSVGAGRGTGSSFLPPSTPWPIAPTFRWMVRRLTTTHDPDGGGHPRLVFAMGDTAQPTDQRRVFDLPKTGTTIGSAPDSDLRLSGIDPTQARIRRDGNDEYVLVTMNSITPTRVNGEAVARERILRTGSRIQIGSWTMTYTREEFADHGRPFGGRAGGEFSRQRKQPPRDYR